MPFIRPFSISVCLLIVLLPALAVSAPQDSDTAARRIVNAARLAPGERIRVGVLDDAYIVYTHNFLDDPVLDRFAMDKKFATKFLSTCRC